MNSALAFLVGLISISNITCKTQFGPCEEYDHKQLDTFKGKNIIVLKKDQVEEKLLQNFKNEDIIVNKVLPSALLVFIEKRRGYIGITKIGLQGIFISSKDGTILSFEKKTALPTLELAQDSQNPSVGLKIDDKTLYAGRILLLVSKIENIKKSNLEKDKITIDLENTQVIFPHSGDPQVLSGSLQLILTQSKMNKKIPTSIDLRYKNPVLKYE